MTVWTWAEIPSFHWLSEHQKMDFEFFLCKAVYWPTENCNKLNWLHFVVLSLKTDFRRAFSRNHCFLLHNHPTISCHLSGTIWWVLFCNIDCVINVYLCMCVCVCVSWRKTKMVWNKGQPGCRLSVSGDFPSERTGEWRKMKGIHIWLANTITLRLGGFQTFSQI